MSLTEIKEEVSRLSQSERLQTMEWLWACMSEDREEMESPEWHGEILAARKARADSGEADFLSIAELQKRLRE